MAAPEESLRKRKAGKAGGGPGSPPGPGLDPTGCSAGLRAGTFWLTRIVLLRALAFIYFVAFLVAFHQNKQLIGDWGLLPCRAYLKSVQQYFRGRVGWDAVSYAPTVLWLLDWSHMDSNLDALALLGLGVSSFVLVTGCANMVLMATLWVLYMSLVNVGQIWYSFGWESQLLETGFLGIFLCPLWTLSRLPRGTPPSRIVLWGFRWLIFRIMLGAGLIKIRGDRCWRDLTCMDFHYETQPVPNPVAYFLHQSPWWVHRGETLGNHFVELVVPFFIFLGRRMCVLHGALQILFQVILIISGNLSFLNWLTMVPSVACFDDATLGFLFPSGPGGLKYRVLKMQEEAARGALAPLRYGCMVRRAVHLALAALVAWLSVPVVLNLLSPTQIMNTSFNPLRIVNTYGAFGSITKERTEVILQGTAAPNASSPDAVWEDYEFKCKPGDPGRRPCLISPYHYRLDWLMWFAAFQTYEHNEWIIHLAGKLLANDASALSLLAVNPFEGRAPPRWLRGEHYRYKFSRPGGPHAAAGKWWLRKRIGPYFPPVSLRDLEDYFRSREWPHPAVDVD
ncbi:lipase maturation factor 1 isoform X1 [Canis lupus baileyi]|uniref:Lipase maturation factor n=1 Tax=Canis lupus familiaris TaxID=9615 RepID=A0A8C0NE39_CANLF|nr:lipase maturation factor 1 isoform X7 [Canis lupus dingo]XP_038396789.1 lipase maturation factor 1 isoform X1 [Canis lupus familiaris]XP_038525590.1 lipase maturation factor 1 isoform X1 [Canis lupus familiaris]XP_547204.2 lipase maturation factor 1 isoform X1 [Canis lupus familiaris]|eukprot:XP_547204.2 lipase maturation factor 1 isoform X3 [Canis lupus familiaris]